MAKLKRILLTAMVAASLAATQAAPAGAAEGDLVRSFSGDGRVVTDLDNGSRDRLAAAQFVSGGRLLVAGSSIKRPYGVRAALVRYLPNGALDPAFGDGGIVLSDADGGFFPEAMTIDQYGAIVVAGSHRGKLVVARMLGEGQPDSEFGDGDGVLSLPIPMQVGGVWPGLNGRIIIAGTRRVSGQVDFIATQLLRDGSLDPEFGDDGTVALDLASGWADGAADLIVDPLDRPVLAGGAWLRDPGASRGVGRFALARLQSDGSLDRTLRHSGTALIGMGRRGGFATAVMTDRRGPIILGGMAPPDVAFVALHDDGTLARGFGHGGRVRLRVRDGYRLRDIAPERKGRILAALGAPMNPFIPGTGDMLALRLLDNGRPDRSFSRDGRVSTGFGRLLAGASVVAQDHLGQFVLAGNAKAPQEDSDFAVARYFGGG
jgi:uncharacterized delta-60 repeat protein